MLRLFAPSALAFAILLGLQRRAVAYRTFSNDSFAGDSGPDCESWFLKDGNALPLGLSMLLMKDQKFPACNEMTKYIEKSFRHGTSSATHGMVLPSLSSSALYTYTSADENTIDCSVLPQATMHIRVKCGRNDAMDEKLAQCYKGKDEKPRTVLGGSPFQAMRYTLSSKGKFAKLMHDLKKPRAPVHPETFIVTDKKQCTEFFEKVKANKLDKPETWILKPVNGYGGTGIDVVSDFKTQLQVQYGKCDGSATTDYIAQRYIKPYLINGTKFHIRTFLLYKFRAAPDAAAPDPEQAWHGKRGELLFCSEPYAASSDPAKRTFATKCNLHNAKANPRYGTPGRTQEDLVKFFQPTMQEALSPAKYKQLIARMDKAMGTLSDAITQHAVKKNIFPSSKEANWMILGCDFQIDDQLNPWLLEANTCPGEPDAIPGDTKKDPYPSIFRVMLTHYRRHFLKDAAYGEASCLAKTELRDQISAVRLPGYAALGGIQKVSAPLIAR